MCCRGTNILFAKYPGGTATQLAARRYNEATALEGVTNAEEIKNAFNSPETISAQEYMRRVRCIFIRCIRLSCCPGWQAINNVSQDGTRKTGFPVTCPPRIVRPGGNLPKMRLCRQFAVIATDGSLRNQGTGAVGLMLHSTVAHCSFAYSTLACLRIGISGSASFQTVRKS